MTPEDAYGRLSTYLRLMGDAPLSPAVLGDVREAWQVLDAALSADGRLPERWDRLTAKAAAHRAGKTSTASWETTVRRGLAPAPDGRDDAGRAWWHPVTVDAYTAGTWRRLPRAPRGAEVPPPASGTGASREAWARWAMAHGVPVQRRMRRDAIQGACREARLIP